MPGPSIATLPGHDSRLSSSLRAVVCVPRRIQTRAVKNSVSHWIRWVISRAYSDSGSPVPRPLARETRGIGLSLLFKKNFSVEFVLRAGTLKRQTTFSRFYLRDLASKTLDTYHLGPVVAAQEVV